jgi:N-acetylglutamate synthase-like GNAT family acetyltransferase
MVEIAKGYIPGAIGRIVELHGAFYAYRAGFGLYFESKVARELCEFMQRYDEGRDGLWLAVQDGRVEGSIAIDGTHAGTEGAHLRWFIVSDPLRGCGTGRRLLEKSLDFCRARGYERVYLWTFGGLAAARRLYEQCGFRLTRQQRGTQWGIEVDEQRFELPIRT